MSAHNVLSRRSPRRGGRLSAALVAAGIAVPGLFIACTPATAAAQGTTDPLGPTIAQVEAVVAHELTLLEVTVSDLELCLSSGFRAYAYCQVPGPGGV